MTQDEIIRFAIQCRLVTTGNRDGIYMDALIEFAHLVATKERAQPPQRTWVGLTDVEIEQAIELISMLHGDYATEVAYAIEAKLKELNT